MFFLFSNIQVRRKIKCLLLSLLLTLFCSKSALASAYTAPSPEYEHCVPPKSDSDPVGDHFALQLGISRLQSGQGAIFPPPLNISRIEAIILAYASPDTFYRENETLFTTSEGIHRMRESHLRGNRDTGTLLAHYRNSFAAFPFEYSSSEERGKLREPLPLTLSRSSFYNAAAFLQVTFSPATQQQVGRNLGSIVSIEGIFERRRPEEIGIGTLSEFINALLEGGEQPFTIVWGPHTLQVTPLTSLEALKRTFWLGINLEYLFYGDHNAFRMIDLPITSLWEGPSGGACSRFVGRQEVNRGLGSSSSYRDFLPRVSLFQIKSLIFFFPRFYSIFQSFLLTLYLFENRRYYRISKIDDILSSSLILPIYYVCMALFHPRLKGSLPVFYSLIMSLFLKLTREVLQHRSLRKSFQKRCPALPWAHLAEECPGEFLPLAFGKDRAYSESLIRAACISCGFIVARILFNHLPISLLYGPTTAKRLAHISFIFFFYFCVFPISLLFVGLHDLSNMI